MSKRVRHVSLIVSVGVVALAAAAARPPPLQAGGRTVVELDTAAVLATATTRQGAFTIVDFPLHDSVDLRVESYRVTGPGTRVVMGSVNGPDRLIESSGFDPSAIVLLRGRVVGEPIAHSRVFMAVSGTSIIGYAECAGESIQFSSFGPDLAPGQIALTRASRSGLVPNVPLCGVLDPGQAVRETPSTLPPPTRGMTELELAVDTDYEFFALFDDVDAAAFYAVALYGAISDVFMDDVNTRLELVYLRLWDSPNDLFNEANPLPPLTDHWNSQMGHVPRDAVQLLTGRRDLSSSGAAWIESLCGSRAYSFAGFLGGAGSVPAIGNLAHWDLVLAAHELAHVCGAGHTHSYGIDACVPLPGVEQRGTIMSYCSVHSGGVANIDLRFHSVVQGVMKSFIGNADCIAEDCNHNHVDDAGDILAGTSADANNNGVPDECEDCNTNSIRDDVEIAAGTPDVNSNGVPDECEADCNDNAVPDSTEIAGGSSDDTNGNNIPDECEEDCNSNGVPDFREVADNMDLDVNRNNRLDACEDCDGDGVSDAETLGGAHNLWVASDAQNVIREYHAATGARGHRSSGSQVSQAFDLRAGPNGSILVTSGTDSRVIEFDMVSGTFLGDFVSSGSGGLAFPAGLAWGPDGHLYVSSRDTDSVLKFDGTTGAFVSVHVLAGYGGLSLPHGLTFGPAGSLFICSGGTHEVIEYDGNTGALIRVFAHSGSGGLLEPRGLTFKPDGNLLVASLGTGEVLEFGRENGVFRRVFNGPISTSGTAVSAWGVRIGPNGNVFVGTHAGENEILEYDVRSGDFLHWFALGPHSGLSASTGIDFAPGAGTDCNWNQIPDSCDVAGGASADVNGNGIPDECEMDCDSNGAWDQLEIIPFGTRFDCNFNGILDDCEIAATPSRDCDGNSLIDDCELVENDCDSNGVLDACELAGRDCNSNGVPDECELAAHHNCCAAAHGAGCDDADIQHCVCGLDPFCCDTYWDRLCVGYVTGHQCGYCPATDCNSNTLPDECDPDCNSNGSPDDCDLTGGGSLDCNTNAVPDECDLSGGTSADCNLNQVPDECEPDFDGDGLIDDCDPDIDDDGVPNETDPCDHTHPGEPINPTGGPMGDIDNDCTVTLSDFFYFEICLSISGPGVPPLFGECLDTFDFDGDIDVDLTDFGGFGRALAQ